MSNTGLEDGVVSLQRLKLPFLAFLAVVFTWALTYVTLELPRILSSILRHYFPDIIWQPESIQALMDYARPLGYACLAGIIALIIVGFISEKKRFASLGSFAFFLPAFGYFAASMFFLAGIGILRVIWMPFWDFAPSILKLGNVAYVPFWVLTYPFRSLEGIPLWQVANSVAGLVVGAGLLIFCIGTVAWFYGRLEKREIFDFWIYKYSRHPQYLGFIVWSYGVMVLTALAPVPFGGYQPEPTLPWLISALLVVCVALSEEIKMVKQHAESYSTYRKNAPFLLPLPRFVSRIIVAPYRMLLKRDYPENSKEVLFTFIIYFIILVLVSILLQELNLFMKVLY